MSQSAASAELEEQSGQQQKHPLRRQDELPLQERPLKMARPIPALPSEWHAEHSPKKARMAPAEMDITGVTGLISNVCEAKVVEIQELLGSTSEGAHRRDMAQMQHLKVLPTCRTPYHLDCGHCLADGWIATTA